MDLEALLTESLRRIETRGTSASDSASPANAVSRDANGFALMPEEAKQLQKSFSNPEFQKYFQEYIKEISDPAAREEQDRYLRELERRSGLQELAPPNVRLIRGKPAFCVRAATHKNNCKIFVNFCTHDDVKPATPTKRADGGSYWSVPFLSSAIRQESEGVLAVDVIFATSSLVWAAKNPAAKVMMIATALDSLHVRVGGSVGAHKPAVAPGDAAFLIYEGLSKAVQTQGVSDNEDLDTSLPQATPNSNIAFKVLSKKPFYGPRAEPDILSHRMQPNDPAVLETPSPSQPVHGPAPPSQHKTTTSISTGATGSSAAAPVAPTSSSQQSNTTGTVPKASPKRGNKKLTETQQAAQQAAQQQHGKAQAMQSSPPAAESSDIVPKATITHVEVTTDVMHAAGPHGKDSFTDAVLAAVTKIDPNFSPASLPPIPKRPTRLQIAVEMPLLKNASQVELDLGKDVVALRAPVPDSDRSYVLKRDLPYPVDVTSSEARWRKDSKTLLVSATVLPPETAEIAAFVDRVCQSYSRKAPEQSQTLSKEAQRQREVEMKQQARRAAAEKVPSSQGTQEAKAQVETPETQSETTSQPLISEGSKLEGQGQKQKQQRQQQQQQQKQQKQPQNKERRNQQQKDQEQLQAAAQNSSEQSRQNQNLKPTPTQSQPQSQRKGKDNQSAQTRKERNNAKREEEELAELEAEVMRIVSGQGIAPEKGKGKGKGNNKPNAQQGQKNNRNQRDKPNYQPVYELPPRVPSTKDTLKPAIRLYAPIVYEDEIEEAMASLPDPSEIEIPGADKMSASRVAMLQAKHREELEKLMMARLLEDAATRRKLMRRPELPGSPPSEASPTTSPMTSPDSSPDSSPISEISPGEIKESKKADNDTGDDVPKIRFAASHRARRMDGTEEDEPLNEKESVLRQSTFRPKMIYTSDLESLFSAIKTTTPSKPGDPVDPATATEMFKSMTPTKRYVNIPHTRTTPAYRYLDANDRITITISLKSVIESQSKITISRRRIELDIASPSPRPHFTWTILLYAAVEPKRCRVEYSNVNIVISLIKANAGAWQTLSIPDGPEALAELEADEAADASSSSSESDTTSSSESEDESKHESSPTKSGQFLEFEDVPESTGVLDGTSASLKLPGQPSGSKIDTQQQTEQKKPLVEVVEDINSSVEPTTTANAATTNTQESNQSNPPEPKSESLTVASPLGALGHVLMSALSVPLPTLFAQTARSVSVQDASKSLASHSDSFIPKSALELD